MKVQEMIEKLKEMPMDADLRIDVSAYYYEGSGFDDVEEPRLNKDGSVSIGSVEATP